MIKKLKPSLVENKIVRGLEVILERANAYKLTGIKDSCQRS